MPCRCPFVRTGGGGHGQWRERVAVEWFGKLHRSGGRDRNTCCWSSMRELEDSNLNSNENDRRCEWEELA